MITTEHARNLDKSYWDLLEIARANDPQAFIAKDYALHTALWQCAQNEHLESILPRIMVPIFGYTAIRVASNNSLGLFQNAQSHLPIIDAVKSHDPEGARQALNLAMDDWLNRGRTFVFDQSTSA
jgi:DNA-binding GntR family transcriptional regulator